MLKENSGMKGLACFFVFFLYVSLKRCKCISEILLHACLQLQTLRTPGTEIKRKKKKMYSKLRCVICKVLCRIWSNHPQVGRPKCPGNNSINNYSGTFSP